MVTSGLMYLLCHGRGAIVALVTSFVTWEAGLTTENKYYSLPYGAAYAE